MTALLLRIGILALVGLLTWAIVWSGRSFVERRRFVAMTSGTARDIALTGQIELQAGSASSSPVHILAFSSADCHQCHLYQMPALRRVTEARMDMVSVEEIDAPTSPELTRRYQVLTVPTTVVLDASGRVQAINYGLANTQRLLEQVDAILATEMSVPS
ncbi:MAG TPA: hypothetical protein VGT44_15325 [Ktedonobacteraceae bacterium]|nr:hypothetical protein [Ktedonobacteraceae bacterium]